MSVLTIDKTSSELLDRLQQDLDSTVSALSAANIARFSKALNHVQVCIDFFSEPDKADCTQQIADILGFQLGEVRAAAQNLQT